MKWQFMGIDGDISWLLVEAAIGNYSAIKYASEIEDFASTYAEIIVGLRCLRANTASISNAEPESLGYERYDDKTYIEVVEDLFHSESIYCDDNHLNDQDYINIVNYKYPNEYDRCAIVKTSFVSKDLVQEGTGRDFSYWTEFYKYNYKVVVRKNVQLDETREYSFEELYSLVKSKDILIISYNSFETFDASDRKKEIISGRQLSKLQREEWLESVKEPNNPFHSEYMAYLKQSITDELINESISACVSGCKKLFEYPKDKRIMNRIRASDYNDAVFEGMSAEQRLSFVKQYEQSNDLINKSRAIFENYSSEYKIIFS